MITIIIIIILFIFILFLRYYEDEQVRPRHVKNSKKKKNLIEIYTNYIILNKT